MKLMHGAAAAVFAACVMFLAACGGSSPAADEAAIREANKKVMDAIVAKDAATIAGVYAEDAQLLPPNAPKAVGREAIQKGWSDMLAAGITLTFETEKVVFAKSGELAVDIGTYKFSMGGMNDTGKSVVTWTKRDGKWLMLTDMFSSDLPPPPPAAPAAAEVPAATPASGDATPAPAAPAPTQPATPPAQ